MSDKDQKNIHVREGQKERDPYGSPGRVPGSRDGWTVGLGGSGGGRGEGGRPGTLSGSKRRRLREEDKRRRQQEARQKAEAERQARIDAAAQAEQAAQAQRDAAARAAAEAQASAHAEAQSKAAAQAQAARELAHRQAVDSLAQALPSAKAVLDQQHASAKASLATRLQTEIQTATPTASNSGQLLLNEILDQKTRVHYLISQNAAERDEKNRRAYVLTGTNPKTIDDAQYRALLLARSSTAEQAHQVHETWMRAYTDAYEAEVLAEFESLLNERSQLLSKRYAEQSWELQNHSGDVQTLSAKQVTDLSRFWQVVTGPTTSPQPSATAADIAKAVAEKMFTRQAAKALGRAIPSLALLYPTELADGELGASIFATSASEIGVSRDMDLAFIASRKGTVDVTHRMTLEETDGELTPAWVKADGVTIGTKVPVRSFAYNPISHAYEFTRDGDTKPSLIWTPAVTPGNSSTFLPAETPDTSPYSGAALSPISDALGDYPSYDIEEVKGLILIFPEESGIEPLYVVFNSPRYLPGVVSGVGGPIDSNWESAASKNLGSPIPSAIADALRGKEYAEFRNLKKAIWREMSKLPEITERMNSKNIELMQKGNSPVAPKGERKGGRMWYEIHHVYPISKGGDVYGIDNLTFNTPANHDNIHSDMRRKEKTQ